MTTNGSILAVVCYDSNGRPTSIVPIQGGDIIGVAEAADVLGVSKQRVSQLQIEDADFPTPVGYPRSGPVWLRTVIEDYREVRRPRVELRTGILRNER
jgi:hypothetical protein